MELPIACTLGPEAYEARKEEIGAVSARALRSRETLPGGGARLTFARLDGIEAELRRIIAAEAECCAFLEFEIVARADEIELVVTGPEGAEQVIDGVFA